MITKIRILTLIAIFMTNSAFSDSSIQGYLEKKVDTKTASAVCGYLPIIDADGVLACEVCPDFVERVLSEPLILHKMVFGNFSSANAKEIAIDTEGCEPHSNNFGGMVLLREQKERLVIGYYQPGFRLHDCLKFESLKDRDILVCNQIYQGQGSTIGQFAAFRFGEYEATWRELQSWIYSEDNESFIKFISAEQEDLNKDDTMDLGLTFKTKAPKNPQKTIRINYLFDGKEFKLSPKSVQRKKELDQLYNKLN